MYILTMKRYVLLFAMIFCIGAILFAQAGRNARFVAVQSTNLKASAGVFANNLAVVTLGETVTLISDNGRWSQVQYGNLTGWIQSNELTSRRITSSGSVGLSATEVALAGKGFTPEQETEYKRGGLDFSMVDFMERITIPSEDLLRFINEGRLNRGD